MAQGTASGWPPSTRAPIAITTAQTPTATSGVRSGPFASGVAAWAS